MMTALQVELTSLGDLSLPTATLTADRHQTSIAQRIG